MTNNARNGSWHTRLALLAYSYARRATGDENLLSYAGPRGLYFAYKRFLSDPFARLPRYIPEVYSGGSIIDVGANVGYTASIFRRHLAPSSRVYAFEPSDSNFRVLQRSMGQLSQVECIQAAVGDRSGEAALLLDANHPGNHRIVGSLAGGSEGRSAGLQRCSMVTLDGFLEDHRVSLSDIRFLKIDVQGFEPAVIRGARQLLTQSSRLSVALEFDPEALSAMGFDSRALLSELQGFGFGLHRLEASGRPHALDTLDASSPCDILCLR